MTASLTPKEQKKLDKKLVEAAFNGDIARIERLLFEGAQVDGEAHFWRHGTMTALQATAIKAHNDAATYLLDHGATIDKANADGETPLMIALRHGWKNLPELLMERGARLDLFNKKGQSALDISIVAENREGTQKVRNHLQRLAQPAPKPVQVSKPAPAPEPPPAPKPAPPKQDPDIVIFTQQAGDRILQDIFNFVSRERITLVRKDAAGPVETMSRQGFSQIESRDYLMRALEEHARRGGKTTQTDIFPDAKPKITQPGANA